MAIDVTVSEMCPECEQEADFSLTGEMDQLVKRKATCDNCGHDFIIVVSLELDSWTEPLAERDMSKDEHDGFEFLVPVLVG